MAFEKVTIFAIVLAVGITFVCASPIPNGQDQEHNDPANTASREGRFYGGGLASAQASAMSTAGGFGMGWPGLGYGGGFGGSSAHAAASAGAMGLGYGR